MKKTLQEEKERICTIMKNINEQNLYADDYGAKKDLEQLQRDEMGYGEESPTQPTNLMVSDHVYCSIETYHISVSDNPHNFDKEPIEISVTGNVNSRELSVEVDSLGNHTEEDGQRAVEMVKEKMKNLPSGFSFHFSKKVGEAEF